ncbi:MAG: RNA methyltransferase [Bacteroidota bacterium]|nr:RNA methyltransferase [Bacteroidota bacterium]
MNEYRQKLTAFLLQFIYERRYERITEVLDRRTPYIHVVLEDIYQSQNASAVLRSCDCFGVQNVHIIENHNAYKINSDVTMGAEKWLTLHHYKKRENNTLSALHALKQKGYRIVATTPRTNDVSLEEFDVSKGKFALCFGAEKPGVSRDIIQQADECLYIPMAGFTESFNISVSAAIILHHLSLKLHQSDIQWQLEPEKYEALQLEWIIKSLKKPELLIKEFEKLNPHLK